MRTIIFALLILLSFKAPTPKLNSAIVEYVDTVIGTQVGSGECWDLAAAALAYAGAYHDRSSVSSVYVFGGRINPVKEEVFPGDIIQFENVKLTYKNDNSVYTETMPHHTAIVYKVIGNGAYVIAHQNTSFGGRKVATSNFNLTELVKGKLFFYRPIKSAASNR